MSPVGETMDSCTGTGYHIGVLKQLGRCFSPLGEPAAAHC